MQTKPQQSVNEKRIATAVQKKVELSVKIRELRLQMAKVNQDLIKAGAIHEIAAW